MPVYGAVNHPVYAAGASVIDFDYNLTAATVTTAGAVASIANPLGVDLIIIQAYLDVSTAATTSANTITGGVAANGTTSSNTLFDALATTAGVKAAGGTGGAVPRKWLAGQFVTATASATLVGMVGTLHLVCVRA